jgi:hypothetical protein
MDLIVFAVSRRLVRMYVPRTAEGIFITFDIRAFLSAVFELKLIGSINGTQVVELNETHILCSINFFCECCFETN